MGEVVKFRPKLRVTKGVESIPLCFGLGPQHVIEERQVFTGQPLERVATFDFSELNDPENWD